MMLNGPIATLTVGSNFVSGIGSANGTNLGEGSAVAYEASALAAAINGTALLRECSWAHTGVLSCSAHLDICLRCRYNSSVNRTLPTYDAKPL